MFFWDLKNQNLGVKQGHYYGKENSILYLNLEDFFDRLSSIFGQYKSKLGQYKITIRQNQVNLWDSTWWFFQQIKLNCGYVQVEIGTVQDDFRTVQVEIGTVQDKDSTKSGEIVGQDMLFF